MFAKLARLLKGDGLFFGRHSESLLFASDLLRLRSHTVYERALAGGASSATRLRQGSPV